MTSEIRWGRLLRRLVLRAAWHIQGLLLWLLQRPALRWVPLPYPAVGDLTAWQDQAETMVANRCLPRRHVTRARQVGAFNAQNLVDATHLRNRMGFQLAFLEDPMLMGMLAARASKGMSHRIRSVALMEAKEEAKKLKESGKQQAAVRELIGPRGGLPTFVKTF